MTSEGERVNHTNDKVLLVRVLKTIESKPGSIERFESVTYPFDKILENFDLDESLMMETLLVSNNLDSYHISSFVIATLQNLTKRTFAENVDDFVSVV